MTEKNEAESLAKELNELGRRIQDVLASAAASPEARALKSELADSLDRVGAKAAEAAKKAQEAAQSAEVKAQAEKVAAAGRKAAGELQKNVASGLRDVSAALRTLADKLEEKK